MIEKPFLSKKHSLMLAVLGGALSAAPSLHAGDLNFSGFMSIGGGFATEEVVADALGRTESFEYYGFYDDTVALNRNIFGLQLTGDISDKVSATAQFTSRSEEDYQIEAEWAYMSYALSDQAQLRFGRLRMPLYLYSDYLDVGYSYPWVAPPREVYYLAVSNIDGVDFYTTGSLGSFDTSFQAYFGNFSDSYDFIPESDPSDPQSVLAESTGQIGAAFTIGRNSWNIRAAYHQTDFTLDLRDQFSDFLNVVEGNATDLDDFLVDEILIEEDSTSFIDLAFTFDNGQFLFVAEHIEFTVDNAFLAKQVRDYVTGGVRFGDFMLHATYQIASDERNELEDLVAGGPFAGYGPSLAYISSQLMRDQQVSTVGLRWDFTPGAAFKIQVDQIARTEMFSITDMGDIVPVENDKDQTVIQFAVQSVF